MRSEDAMQQVLKSKVVAILRGDFGRDDLLAIVDAIVQNGLNVIELTLNSGDALRGIAALRSHVPTDVVIGAGTVRTVSDANEALEAGAQFLVSPNLDLETVEQARRADVLHLPGVFTPSEAQQAINAGCRLLKLFPCDTVGPGHVKALRGPLDEALFVPTGGVSADNVGDFLRAGAAAVGVGGELMRNGGSPESVGNYASRVVRAVQDFQQANESTGKV